MEILITRQVLAEARRNPRAVIKSVRELVAAPAKSTGTVAIEGNRVLGWNQRADRLELVALAPESALASAHPLADLSIGELRGLGVADDAIQAVQGVVTAADLHGLPLPESVRQRLLFRILQKGVGIEAELELRAEDPAHLEQYLRGEITDLLLNLDENQRPVVNLPVPGTIIVRGVAGSGKTAVALHRIHALVRNGSRLNPPRILYLTYNRALATAAHDLLDALGVRSAQVETMNLHRWCKRFLGAGFPRKLLDTSERLEMLQAARARARAQGRSSSLWMYPDSFWDEELHRVHGQVLGGREDYLGMVRHGALRPLDRKLRELVWDVSEAYLALCAEKRVADWDRVTRLAHDRLVGMGTELPAYDHVFVDEGQDFTVVGLRIAATLAGPPGNLMVVFDPAQSIYERGFRWRSCGITVHGSRSFALPKNHRNSIEILEFARPLLDVIRSDPGEAAEGEDLISPIAGRRTGAIPQVIEAPAGHEAEHVASLIVQDVQGALIPPGNIAVLCFKKYKLQRIEAALQAAGVLYQSRQSGGELRLSDPSVKLLTMHSAKGLEFPVVYLAASARDFKVPRNYSEPADRAAYLALARKIIYMAMTRAVSRLTIIHDTSDGSPLDAVLASWTLPDSTPAARQPAPLNEIVPALQARVYAQGYLLFHKETCEHLGGAPGKTRYESRQVALRKGLRPCRSCAP